MIQGHLNELRSVVEQATDLPAGTRAKLLQLTAELERDLQGDAIVPPLGAHSTSVPPPAATSSADEATGATPESGPVHGLVSAIEGLESSHPEVTAAANNIARMLSKLGF